MRVCLLPLYIQTRNPAANWKHFQERLNEVAPNRPDLICLPECAFTGYLYTKEDLQQFAEPIPGPTTRAVARLAQEHHCCICFGMLEQADEDIYDSALLIDQTGEILFVHRKINEHAPFRKGDQVQTADTSLGRIAILICGDLFDDKIKARINRPVDCILVPMARSFDNQSPDAERWLHEERRAYLDEVEKLGALTCLVNLLETPAPEASFGGAMVVDPDGRLLAEAPHGTDEALWFEVNTGNIG